MNWLRGGDDDHNDGKDENKFLVKKVVVGTHSPRE